jgi:para-aminobenzoate synthetase/4-amino-4-deoxychorismate lyase
VRFDDLTVVDGSFVLDDYLHEIAATRPDDVAAAIAAAEAEARQGRWVAGFVGYGAAPGLDARLAVRAAPSGDAPPLVWFGVFGRRQPADPPAPLPPTIAQGEGGWSSTVDDDCYRARFARVRSHLSDGDTYQLNLTHPWQSPGVSDPTRLYHDLLLAQRPAYGALIDTGRWVVASASPELFFHCRRGVLTCRPMKGTARRGRWAAEDRRVAAELASSAKNRAENVMIVDLVRNDLGRVADYGTVVARDLFTLERYPTVWQLTSEVAARSRAGTTLVDVFRALFPCGSVTGAPKHRTMELITEVEGAERGVYCGAVGFVGPEEARFSVAIRTAVIDRATGRATYGSGGGIVWDSDPERELAEAHAKTAILRTPVTDFDLVETMAFHPGLGLRNRGRHLDRMAASAQYFGYPFHRGAVGELLDEAIALHDAPSRVRLSLSASGRAALVSSPLPAPGNDPVRLVIDDFPVDPSDIWLFHKTSRRGAYAARLARHPGAEDVVLVNDRGEATETTIANLAVRLEGRWRTPPLDAGCLPGVERARLLEDATLTERTVTLAQLRSAADIAVVSSVRGWRRAVLWRRAVIATDQSGG